jgi:hypothetical protein
MQAEADPSRERRSPGKAGDAMGMMGGEEIHRAKTEPAMGSERTGSAMGQQDRRAIKVKVVTWNMGDSLVRFQGSTSDTIHVLTASRRYRCAAY